MDRFIEFSYGKFNNLSENVLNCVFSDRNPSNQSTKFGTSFPEIIVEQTQERIFLQILNRFQRKDVTKTAYRTFNQIIFNSSQHVTIGE